MPTTMQVSLTLMPNPNPNPNPNPDPNPYPNPNPNPNQLASVVVFSERHVLVYPSADAKPPAGEGLNRRCEVTMEGVWPRDRKTGEDLRDARSVREFRAKLQNQADRLGASMLEYDGELGRWRFRVEHF